MDQADSKEQSYQGYYFDPNPISQENQEDGYLEDNQYADDKEDGDQPKDQVTILYENLTSLPGSPYIYREEDFKRIVASIQSASSLLVVGDQGSGKTFLAEQVYKALLIAGFSVAYVEPCTT
ncbi:ATP-binding protein, partial [Cylindrospermopsis raciborskii]|uniref:ATP-binding protein n=1 Tax=Cylindrospermopsis raciborskii TaxID=77022 RepID=UPI003DA642B6